MSDNVNKYFNFDGNGDAICLTHVGHLFFKDALVAVSRKAGDNFNEETIYKWYNDNYYAVCSIVNNFNSGFMISEIVHGLWDTFMFDMKNRWDKARKRSRDIDFFNITLRVNGNFDRY